MYHPCKDFTCIFHPCQIWTAGGSEPTAGHWWDSANAWPVVWAPGRRDSEDTGGHLTLVVPSRSQPALLRFIIWKLHSRCFYPDWDCLFMKSFAIYSIQTYNSNKALWIQNMECYDLTVSCLVYCFCSFIIFIICLILFSIMVIHSQILPPSMHSCSPVMSLCFHVIWAWARPIVSCHSSAISGFLVFSKTSFVSHFLEFPMIY